MADIGDLYLRLVADPQPFEAGLDTALANSKRFEAQLAASPMDSKRFERVRGAAAGGLGSQAAGLEQQAERTNFEASLAAQGKGVGDITDALTRFSAVQKLANQIQAEGEDRTQALSRASVVLAGDLSKLAGAQATNRAAEAARDKASEKGLLGKTADSFKEQFKGGVFSQGGAMVAGLAGGLLKSSLNRQPGEMVKPSEVLGTMSEFASFLPGPLGSITKTITGALGTLLDFLTKESRIVAERAGNALASIVDGSRNAGQAVAGVRLDSMREDLTAIVRDAAAGNLQNEVMGGGRESLDTALQRRLGVVERRANSAAAITERIANNPALAGQFTNLAQMQTSIQISERGMAGLRQRGINREEGGALAGGQLPEFARAAGEREGVLQDFMRQGNLNREQALERIGARLGDMQQGQQRDIGAQASRDVGASIQASGEEIDMMTRRMAILRDTTPFLADMSVQERSLDQARRRGADAAMLEAGALQINAERFAREREQVAQFGRGVVESTRTALETFERQNAQLERAFQQGELNPDQLGRGLEEALQSAERAIGEAPVGQAAATEGSVQAASIIARAQRQNEREDVGARLERVMREGQAMDRAAADRARAFQDAFQQGRFFRAVNPP